MSIFSRPGIRSTSREPLGQEPAGPVDLEPHQFEKRRGRPALPQVVVGVPEAEPVFARQVDSRDVEIAGDILPEAGQLEPGADGVRPADVLVRHALAEMEDDPSHRIGAAAAVVLELGGTCRNR